MQLSSVMIIEKDKTFTLFLLAESKIGKILLISVTFTQIFTNKHACILVFWSFKN